MTASSLQVGARVRLAARDFQHLLASEIKFRRIVETAHEGIWLLDRDGGTTYMNRRMADMLGLDPTQTGLAELPHFLAELHRLDHLPRGRDLSPGTTAG